LKFFQGFPYLFLYILLRRLYLGIGHEPLSGSPSYDRSPSFGCRWSARRFGTSSAGLGNYTLPSLFSIVGVTGFWCFFFLFGLFTFGEIYYVPHNFWPAQFLICGSNDLIFP